MRVLGFLLATAVRRHAPPVLVAQQEISSWLEVFLETADPAKTTIRDIERQATASLGIQPGDIDAQWLEDEVVRLQSVPGSLASLLICVNTNICGRRNPTHIEGFGWARKAIHCARTLGPPGLQVTPGTCFIRCSRGVNAQLNSNTQSIRSQPLFRLNGVNDVVAMMKEEMGHEVDDDIFDAYQAYTEAEVLLDDVYASIEGVSQTARAYEALPLLDRSISYVQRKHPARTTLLMSGQPPQSRISALLANLTATVAAPRANWAGSRWKESYYASELTFPSSTGDSGSAMKAKYGGQVEGSVEGVQAVAPPAVVEFRGKWFEGGASGEVVLEMAADGLSFVGSALCDGEPVRWTGERLPPPPVKQTADPPRQECIDRWFAEVLTSRATTHLRLGRPADATRDAITALGFAHHHADAWDVLSKSATAASDERTAAIALSELLYLRPGSREAAFQLSKLRGRTGLSLATAQQQPLAAPAQDSTDVERRRESTSDSSFDVQAAKAIFADEYAIGDTGTADTA